MNSLVCTWSSFFNECASFYIQATMINDENAWLMHENDVWYEDNYTSFTAPHISFRFVCSSQTKFQIMGYTIQKGCYKFYAFDANFSFFLVFYIPRECVKLHVLLYNDSNFIKDFADLCFIRHMQLNESFDSRLYIILLPHGTLVETRFKTAR